MCLPIHVIPDVMVKMQSKHKYQYVLSPFKNPVRIITLRGIGKVLLQNVTKKMIKTAYN